MHKVQMHAGAISKLVYYVFASVEAIIHELKLVDYLSYRRTNHTITSACRTSMGSDKIKKVVNSSKFTNLKVIGMALVH